MIFDIEEDLENKEEERKKEKQPFNSIGFRSSFIENKLKEIAAFEKKIKQIVQKKVVQTDL